MNKIGKLTPEQKAQIPVYIDRFLNLAKKPTNREKSTEAIGNLYESIGEKKPIVIYAQSPFSAVIMAATLKILSKDKLTEKSGQLRSQLGGQLRSQLYDQLYDQLGDQLGSQLGSQLGDQLYDQLGDQLGSQLGDQLRDQLYDQLGSQLGSQLYDQLRDQLGDQLGSQLYDQLRDQLGSQLGSQLKDINKAWWLLIWLLSWAGWYSFGKYIGIEYDPKTYKLFMDFVTNVSFIIPYKGIVFVSETPKDIFWSDQKMLHNESGAAVQYADGYGLYSLNGVRFDKELFEKVTSGTMPFQDILAIEDIDQRTQAMKFGNPREFIEHAGGSKLDDRAKYFSEGLVLYELYKIPQGEIFETDAYYMLYTDPSTGKEYMSGVEPCQTVAEAMSWKHNITVDQWESLVPLVTEA